MAGCFLKRQCFRRGPASEKLGKTIVRRGLGRKGLAPSTSTLSREQFVGVTGFKPIHSNES